MPLPIYFVGTLAEAGQHALPLAREFDVRIEDAEGVLRRALAGDVCVFYNEFFPRYRLANHLLRARNCATLYCLDGIFEWRSLWDFPAGMSVLWSARPMLSHKVACIGRSQARVMASWGYADQAEVVGVPRFDMLRGRRPRQRSNGEPFTILVMTAKCAGFDQAQLQRTTRSLCDLKAWGETHPNIHGTPVRLRWRITQELDQQIGVPNELRDTTGQDLARALSEVDAVVTTPSTTMLEAMLCGLPTALLDYHNAPHLVPAAWRIGAAEHLDRVLPELLTPLPALMHYQRHLLRDALECLTPALPRMSELIATMYEQAQRCVAAGGPVSFPPQILPLAEPDLTTVAEPLDYAALFPQNRAFGERDLPRLQAELADLREEVLRLRNEVARLRGAAPS